MTKTLSAGATAGIAELVREHHATREPLRVAGASTWLHAGAPVRAATTIATIEDSGVVEYVPGDLTITVRAGTRLREIAVATSANGQWLPLDPWGGDEGTLGATVATATAGPRVAAFGLARDAVLGMEFVTGTGSVVRAGGRVVKNVAGFDLARLLIGSWGTLGIITELTVRLRAKPQKQETIAVELAGDSIRDVAARLRQLSFTLIGAQIVNAPLAQHLDLPPKRFLLGQIGGNAHAVAAQRDVLNQFGRAEIVSDDVWDALRTCDRGAVASWRWSRAPSSFAETWTSAERAAAALGALVHGDPWRGVARLVARQSTTERLGDAASRFGGTRIIEVLPAGERQTDTGSRLDAISRAVRAKFDPGSILNPGILGEAA